LSLFFDVINGKQEEELMTEVVADIDSENDVMMEAVYPDNVPYLKLINKKITLPKGTNGNRGNLCFLYTNNTDESLNLMTNTINFVNANKYFYYYYNPMYSGKLYGKTFRIRELDLRKELYKKVLSKSQNKIHPYIKLAIDGKDDRNLYYDLSKHMNIFLTLCEKISPVRKIKMYWDYLRSILFAPNLTAYQNRFVLIDVSNYPMYKNLKENMTNPVFMLYYTLLKYPDMITALNIDFYMFTDKKSLKFNPYNCDKKTYTIFRREMNRLYSNVSFFNDAVNEEQIKKDEAVENTIGELNNSINNTKNNTIITSLDEVKQDESKATYKPSSNKVERPAVSKSTLGDRKVITSSDKVYNAIRAKAVAIRNEVEKIAPDAYTKSLTSDNIKTAVQTKLENDIDSDKELLNTIYDEVISPVVPKKTASTARDEELRKAQADLKIKGMTIKEIEKIQASHIQIPTHDVSASVRTSNKNVTQLKFDNFDKEYNEKLMPKDITDAILSLNNKSLPMFVRDIKIQDSSDELNYKDTYTIYLEDTNRKRHTIKVDIPKFIEDKFIYIGGNRKVIKKQNLLYPVVKTSSNIVQLTTNYNKMFIERVGTKSLSSIERLKTVLKKSDEIKKYFTYGNCISINNKFITTVEYDELSKIAIKFKKGKTEILFNQNEAIEFAKKRDIPMKKGYIFIGLDKSGSPIYINEETQKTDNNDTIVYIMLNALSDEEKHVYESTRAPKRLMYARAKVLEQYVAVGLLLGFWEGLSSLLKKGKVKYRLDDKFPELKPNESYLRFADCYLVYESTVGIDLLINGYRFLDTQNYKISEMDTKEPYMPYLIKVWGKAAIANALLNVYEFMMDPITVEVCKDINIPYDLIEIIIYAVSLLSDSQYTPEINQGLSRIRCNEIIPAILYERLAKKYILYRNSNGKKAYSVPQDCVIKELIALKTVEDYSTLNPTLEMEMFRGISSKGFRGANLDESYTVPKRTFDKTSIGVISPSTSPDGSCGVSKTLTFNPSITSLRGYVDLNYVDSKNEKLDTLHDVDVFSPAELTIPLGATNDDPTRLGHALKQSKHTIPVKKSSPVLISNGMEEVCRFQLSSDFAVNAAEDGIVVDYKDDIMVVKYNSGKCQAVNLGHTIVKNGGGGFFLSNQLITTLKVGDKFKKDSVLAYHKDFFTNDKFNNCRMNMGTLTKVAIMSTYNTYQDATMITQKLSDEASTEMCFLKSVVIGKNANVEYMVKKGQEIKVGDSLIQFDTSFEDNSLNTLLANLSQEEQSTILEGSRNDIHSKYSGVIEEIKIYSTVELDELSPSLRKIVSNYYSTINAKKKFLEKYDPDSAGSIVKCGLLVNETSKKIEPNKFGVIKGEKIEEGGVLIEFYVKHSEPLEVGSKIANFTALKNTIGEIIPAGYEPWSSYRPEEEVSTIIASNSILKRMTPSILLTALGNKCIIELKRSLKEIYDKKD
jgi:hypothetical protein